MEFVEFEVGTKSEWGGSGTIEVVKKTPNFTTFKIVSEDIFGEALEITFRRKEHVMTKDNGWLDPATFTMGVDWRGIEIYACDFN